MSLLPAPAATGKRAALLLVTAGLVLGGCSGGDGAPEVADAPTAADAAAEEPAEESSQEPADADAEDADESGEDAADGDTAATDDAAAAEGQEQCAVDAATVTSVFSPVFGAEVEFLDSRTDERGGVSCSFETTGGEVFVNFGVGESVWDGSQEEVDELVATVTEFKGEPTSRPDDLGDAAVLFNADGSGTYHLAVFSGQTVYNIGMTGDLEGSAEQRREVLVGMYEAAAE